MSTLRAALWRVLAYGDELLLVVARSGRVLWRRGGRRE